MNKNDIYELEIIDSGMAFEGIAKPNKIPIFVPGAIIGERVLGKIIKVNKNYAIARIEQLTISSSFRHEPFCEVYSRCGGCSVQHIEYNMQLTLKAKMIENLFRKQKVQYEKLHNTIGMGMPYYYRNKVQYPVRVDNDGNATIGFYSKRSHDIVPNNCCYIQNRVIDMLAKDLFDELLRAGFSGYNEQDGSGDIRHILIRRGYHTKEVLITVIVNDESILYDTRFVKIANRFIEKNDNIRSFYLNLNNSRINTILGEKNKHIAGEKYISDIIGSFKYYIGPKSFFQVNTIQAEVLYSNLKNLLELDGSEIVFDLYSGVGSIGIFLSDKVKAVYGIEIEPEAVEMANLNILENNVKNAEYVVGSVEDKIEEYAKRDIKPDVIVVDPPRKGLDEKSIEYLLEFDAKKIGYVSCNPATLVRDLKLLESKYSVKEVVPVDMFPQTEACEVIAILKLKE